MSDADEHPRDFSPVELAYAEGWSAGQKVGFEDGEDFTRHAIFDALDARSSRSGLWLGMAIGSIVTMLLLVVAVAALRASA